MLLVPSCRNLSTETPGMSMDFSEVRFKSPGKNTVNQAPRPERN